MDIQDFIKQLNQVQELMQKENYKEAISIIEKLKEIETDSDYNYNLTHRLYQLDSNARSLYNQQIIIKYFRDLSKKYRTISFQDLAQMISTKKELNLTEDILRREIELLILRNQLPWKIEKDNIILNSS